MQTNFFFFFKSEEVEEGNEMNEKLVVFTVGHGQNSLKQPKLLLTAVWPTERFQQLDSIKGFLRGGRPHPCCMSHFLTHKVR